MNALNHQEYNRTFSQRRTVKMYIQNCLGGGDSANLNWLIGWWIQMVTRYNRSICMSSLSSTDIQCYNSLRILEQDGMRADILLWGSKVSFHGIPVLHGNIWTQFFSVFKQAGEQNLTLWYLVNMEGHHSFLHLQRQTPFPVLSVGGWWERTFEMKRKLGLKLSGWESRFGT